MTFTFAHSLDSHRRRSWKQSIAGVAVAIGAVLGPHPPHCADAQEVTGEEVKEAIRKGIEYLRNAQDDSGGWREYGMYQGGTTAMAVLALRAAGVPADDAAVARGAERIRRTPNRFTYVVALKIQALAAVDPKRYRSEIEAAAKWLAGGQQESGSWGYGDIGGSVDHSNAQFALLGLHEAARAGVRIADATWRRAEAEWLRTQNPEGGWSYRGRTGRSTGSMTAAGVASLYITGGNLVTGTERGYTEAGRGVNCGRYSQNRAIAEGIDWLARNFSATSNPGSGVHYYYYLYGLERVGILSGLRYFGRHDWYREGAAQLVHRQQSNGRWIESHDIVDTSFALLFLGKGHRSILINKLKWSRDDRWNQDRNDINNLIQFIGDKLGEPVTWQVVELNAPLEEWLAAPILYFNGHEFPVLSAEQVKKFNEYVRQGGAIVAEACCSRAEFRSGFESFAREAFPDTPLHPLGAAHGIYHAHFELGPDVEIHGIDLGCRTSVVFLPRDVSCLWEQADVPKLSEQAFRVGTNIAAYLIGRQKLRDRLDIVHIVRTEPLDTPITPSALRIAQIIHNGDWYPDPRAMPNLAAFLREHADVDIVRQTLPVRPTDTLLSKHPIAFMSGHFSFKLTDADVAALRTYLHRGGFLFADACCGRKAFDVSFREMVRQLYPDQPMEELPPTHPILSGELGFDLRRVTYSPTVAAETPELNTPVLEGITLNGRTVLVYSRYAIGCPIDGHACHDCRGLDRADARKLAANIVLYALSY